MTRIVSKKVCKEIFGKFQLELLTICFEKGSAFQSYLPYFSFPFLAGFEIDRSQQKLHELYDRLPHNEDGSVKIKKKESYSVRTGLTKPPMFLVLDVTQVSTYYNFYKKKLLPLHFHYYFILISDATSSPFVDLQP